MELNKENNKEAKKGIFKGIGMMGVCCLLPIIMSTLSLLSSPLGLAGTRIASLLSSLVCPIMMSVMMISLLKGKSCCSKEDKNKSEE